MVPAFDMARLMWLSTVRTDKVSRVLRVTQDDDEAVVTSG
jgi:hypothetical protein